MEITTYRVKQYSSKMIFVVCVEGIPFCTVRGKNALNRIIQRLNGIDVQFEDKRIESECDKLIKELSTFKTNDGEMFITTKGFEKETRADERINTVQFIVDEFNRRTACLGRATAKTYVINTLNEILKELKEQKND